MKTHSPQQHILHTTGHAHYTFTCVTPCHRSEPAGTVTAHGGSPEAPAHQPVLGPRQCPCCRWCCCLCCRRYHQQQSTCRAAADTAALTSRGQLQLPSSLQTLQGGTTSSIGKVLSPRQQSDRCWCAGPVVVVCVPCLWPYLLSPVSCHMLRSTSSLNAGSVQCCNTHNCTHCCHSLLSWPLLLGCDVRAGHPLPSPAAGTAPAGAAAQSPGPPPGAAGTSPCLPVCCVCPGGKPRHRTPCCCCCGPTTAAAA